MIADPHDDSAAERDGQQDQQPSKRPRSSTSPLTTSMGHPSGAPPSAAPPPASSQTALRFTPLLGHDPDRHGDSGADTESDEDSTSHTLSVRANDVIDLVFVDSWSADSEEAEEGLALFSPEFTHQLFADETISFVDPLNKSASKCSAAEPHGTVDEAWRVTVICRLSDLQHLVLLPPRVTTRERRKLVRGLRGAVPATSIYLDTSSSTDIAAVADTFAAAEKAQSPRIGQLLHSFSVSSVSADFEIWLATAKDVGCLEIIKRFEKLAVWFIETADSVDFADDRWSCLLLVRVDTMTKAYSFIGYYTLFAFRNPFSGTRLRVCQALVLPSCQGQGLGRQMLLAVYRHAASIGEIVEVTVEDPCEGFQRMRDQTDLEWICSHPQTFSFGAIPRPVSVNTSNAVSIVEAAASLDAEKMSADLKITVSQIHTVVDAIVHYYFAKCESEDGASMMTAFRLRVKRRLLNDNPDLRGLLKTDMQRELEELFVVESERFERLGKRIAKTFEAR